MFDVLQSSPKQVAIIFPSNDDNVFQLKLKCEQFGITTESDNQRSIQLFYQKEELNHPNAINEKILKDWFNDMQPSIVFENEQMYNNWKQLLDSEQEENIVLAISLLNTPTRPEDKYFALWIAAAAFHSSVAVQETATQLAFQYLTKEELEKFGKRNLRDLLYYKFKQDGTVQGFIDINYIQFWAKSFKPRAHFLNPNKVVLSTKNIDDVIQHPKFSEWIMDEIHELELLVEDGDDLSGLESLAKNYTITKSIKIVSVASYPLKKRELRSMNVPYLKVKNVIFPELSIDFPPLGQVNRLEWEYPEDIDFSDVFFPNIKQLDLKGDNVRNFNIPQIKKQLSFLQLSFRQQNHVPSIVYDCTELKGLHIHYSKIKAFSPAISNLQKLTSLCIEGTELEEFPTDFFRLPNVEFMYGISVSREKVDFKPEYQYYGPNRLFFSGKTVREFPYGLASLKGLNELNLNKTSISSIDERISKFKIKKIYFDSPALTKIPDALKGVKTLTSITLYNGQIDEISFDWVKHVNENGLYLSLTANPIEGLPLIPTDFDTSQVVKNRGTVSLDRKCVSRDAIVLYKQIFGEKFLHIRG